MRNKTENKLQDVQAVFRSNRPITDNFYILENVIEISLEVDQPLYL